MLAPPEDMQVGRFGPYEVHLATGELRKHGIRLRLQDQPFQILVLLLARPGELVARDELRQRLWPSGTFVDFDNGLNTALSRLREALGDSAENPRYIETLARRGYRWMVSVDWIASRSTDLPAAEAPSETEATSDDLIGKEVALGALSENAGSATAHPRKKGRETGLFAFIGEHKLWMAAGLVLVGLLLGPVLYSTRVLRSSNVSHAKTTHKQFTFTGDAYSPAISPDGLFAAYVSR